MQSTLARTRGLGRRELLTLLATFAAAGLPHSGQAAAPRVATSARIVIAGAGAAGLTLANRLAARLDGAEIILIDGREAHYYQPGFTLVGAGLKPQGYPVSRTVDYIPAGVTLIPDAVVEFDPDARVVVTAMGRRVDYDYLFVATGLALDYGAIEGMSTDLIGRDGIGSVYAGPEAAAATWSAMSAFADAGGVAHFGRPATEMKCAGAPLKYAFLTEDTLARRGNRDKAELTYYAHNDALFGVPIVSEKVRMLFADRGVAVKYGHVLSAIDPGRRVAVYATPDGPVEADYDFIHVVPPMRAPEPVRNSPLAWAEGPFAADGWVEVDRHTLRHARYPDIFAVGDIAGVPKGKTAASVKWQAPVAVDHLVAEIAGGESAARYDGYTSCPLITRIGRAMLIEFDYDNNLTPSFPGVIAPLEELWVSWLMKETALKPTYIAMLRGEA